ncbi:MAG: rod shape-determining protein MreC [Aureispira sp.]|nr:rod shape-determining protein MreC [Aureispira sp.]
MQRLFSFLLKFNSFFVFLLLEIIALFLFFSRNINSEKRAFISSANGLIGGLYEYSNKVSRYWNLAAVNDSLARENAQLKMLLPNSKFDHLINGGTKQDSLYQQQYQYTEAVVVKNTTNKPNNFITINRGINHKVRDNTGVINATGQGIVGIVRKVSGNYASVMSILNKDIRISSKIKRNNYPGSLYWEGADTRYMRLESIPKHASIQTGDTIETSGYSITFPKGIMIGTVDSFWLPSGSNFYSINVQLVNDMNNVEYVYVVDDLMREERLTLEKKSENE